MEQTWNKELWKRIEKWADNQQNRRTSHLATSDYNEIEEFIQGMLDEKDKEIEALKSKINLQLS